MNHQFSFFWKQIIQILWKGEMNSFLHSESNFPLKVNLFLSSSV